MMSCKKCFLNKAQLLSCYKGLAAKGIIAVAVYATLRQQRCREEKSLRCLMIHDHFDFFTAYIQDGEEEMKGIKGRNRRNSAVGNTV